MLKMRLGWYAGVSTALAGAVIISAFQQRANFYSAMVYLAQSNFCLLAMVNFTLLLYSSFIYGLTRLCFGTLRAVEVEQLTERAWFAITETCLAMTIFREEIGAWFLAMFTALVTGKVWGWIGDGRVEFLEQQPPANPTLFHLRLSVSLAISFIYDVWILKYAVETVIQQARPNMMVMFLFEFAVLATCSSRTVVRYILSLAEQNIVKAQTRQRLAERRQEVRRQREEMIRRREQATADGQDPGSSQPLPREEDVDEIDIEVPGWSAKGEWILWLDLITDMIKLGIYGAFFFMLLKFYGLPIHIMRDLFMTSRDFIKRVNALLRYRRAIQEMNRYPDAGAEELAQENTCIICREEMRPWNQENQQAAIDRIRPKKLPCGHVLHLGCLKSWLERQQVCPTCRSPVSMNSVSGAQNRAAGLRIQIGGAPQNAGQQQQAGGNNAAAAGVQPAAGDAQPPPQANQGGPRVFNLGPIRFGFGAGPLQARELAQQFGIPVAAGDQANPGALAQNQNQHQNQIQNQAPAPAQAPAQNQPTLLDIIQQISELIQRTEQTVQRELHNVQTAQQELQVAHLLMTELQRLRQRRQQQQQQQQQQPLDQLPRNQYPLPAMSNASAAPPFLPQIQNLQAATQSVPPHSYNTHFPGVSSRIGSPQMVRHPAPLNGAAIPVGSQELPDGVVLPPGWSLIPLQRLGGVAMQPQVPSPAAETQTPSQSGPANSNPPATPSGTPQANETMDQGVPATAAEAPANSTADAAHDETGIGAGTESHGPVVAPSPLAPLWGGSSQLFSDQPPSRPEHTAENRSGESLNLQGDAADAQSSESQISSVSPEGRTNGQTLQAREEGTKDGEDFANASLKGKAKAVTVEEVNGEDADE